MKVLRLLLLLCLPLTSTAQNTSPAGVLDVLVIDYKLGPFMRVDVSISDAPQGESQPDPLTKAQSSVTPAYRIDPPRYQTKLKPEIKVRNIGARTIKNIDCEFRLTSERSSATEMRALTIDFSKELRPGDTVRLSKLINADHLGTWRQRQKEGSISVRASITRIQYEDGSVWERGPLRLQFPN